MSRSRVKRNLDVSGRIDPTASRWARVCAWDGHELKELDYVQVSDHERVCLFHYPQFREWVEDVSYRMYRAEGTEDDGADQQQLGMRTSS